jgi:uncharacterized protein YqfB (UPF0267 family)
MIPSLKEWLLANNETGLTKDSSVSKLKSGQVVRVIELIDKQTKQEAQDQLNKKAAVNRNT